MLTGSRMPNGHALATTPYPTPAPGEPVRLALVGHPSLIAFSPPPVASPTLETLFVEAGPGTRADSVRDHLAWFGPHAVVVFDPDGEADALLDGVTAATLAFLCGRLPPLGPGSTRDALATQVAAGVRPQFDRVVSCDPVVTDAVDKSAVWRSLPLPVSDALFRDVRTIAGRPRSVFLGRSSEHRERILLPAKHHHDLLHAVYGLEFDELVDVLAGSDVGVHLNIGSALGFSSRALVHLAAGQLLISEPLLPAHGLEVNIDYLQLSGPGMLVETLERLERFPDTYHAIRVRGRMKAEQYRASRVFDRLIGDLFDDIAAFGTERI